VIEKGAGRAEVCVVALAAVPDSVAVAAARMMVLLVVVSWEGTEVV